MGRSRRPRPDVPHGALRTTAQQNALAEEYFLLPVEVLLLKYLSFGVTRQEAAKLEKYSESYFMSMLSKSIYPKLRAKNEAQAVGNALRIGIIS